MSRITFSDLIGVIRKGQLPDYLKSGYDVPTSSGSGNEDGIAGHVNDTTIHLSQENVEDIVAALVDAGVGIKSTYDDAGNLLIISITTNIPIAGYVDFDEIAPPTDPAANVIRLWAEDNGGFGQLHFKNSNGLSYQLGRDNIHTIRNNTGATIPIGSCVYINDSTGVFPTVALAKANSETTMPAAGFVVADIPNNSFGQMMTKGDVQGIDTSAFADGEILYVSETIAGEVTTTEPAGGNDVQRIGMVVNSGVGNGVIAVLIGSEFKPSTALNWLETQQATPAQILARTRML